MFFFFSFLINLRNVHVKVSK